MSDPRGTWRCTAIGRGSTVVAVFIARDSPLVRLPADLDRRQFKLLNALRLTIESVGISYSRLHAQLAEFSCAPPATRSIRIPSLLTDAWAVVTSFDQVRQLACRYADKQPSPTLSPFQDEFLAVRNDHAHRMERLVTEGYDRNPDFGVLRWLCMETPSKGVGYAVIGGNIAGQVTRELNPLSLGTPRGPGVQCVTLDSFVATARLTEGVRAVLDYTRKLEDVIRPQIEGHPGGPADVTVVMPFGPVDEAPPEPPQR